jgi:iron-sulfur cluster assembly protein
MLELTANAKKELDAYFTDKDKQPVRIHIAPGGCAGPRLSLALDDPDDNDESYSADGYTFCIERSLAKQATYLRVDITHMGFEVDSDIELPAGGGCGSSCGTGGSSCGTGGSCCG